MDEIIKSSCENAVVKLTLIFATFGLLAALSLVILLFGFTGLKILLPGILTSLFAAIVALYSAALVFGKIASRLLCSTRDTDSKIGITGVGVAWGCLLISVLVGSSVEFFAEINRSSSLFQAFFDYIIKPLFWVMFFGIIPALILGNLYATRLRKLLQEYR